jgi:hypothetical protein
MGRGTGQARRDLLPGPIQWTASCKRRPGTQRPARDPPTIRGRRSLRPDRLFRRAVRTRFHIFHERKAAASACEDLGPVFISPRRGALFHARSPPPPNHRQGVGHRRFTRFLGNNGASGSPDLSRLGQCLHLLTIRVRIYPNQVHRGSIGAPDSPIRGATLAFAGPPPGIRRDSFRPLGHSATTDRRRLADALTPQPQ